MIRPHTGPKRRQTDVWVLSAIAALNCWVVPLAFAFSELSIPYRTMGDIFPFPAVYFIEIVGLGIAGLFSVYYTDPGRNSRVRTAPTQGIFSTGEDAPANRPGILSRRSFWAAVPWVCAGITLTFVILGSATIGLYLLPAFFSFLILGIVIDRKEKGDIPLHFICFISAGIAQSLLVYLFVLSSL
jgi:hypothetical protein